MFTSLIIGAVVAVLAATASTAQALQQKKQDKTNAKIAESNARAAMRHAENIDLQADQERLQLRLKAQQAVGKQRAKTAASGFVLGQGTSNDQIGDLASAFALDMKNLNYDIASRVWQQKMKSAEYQNQANAYKASASNAGKQIGYVWGMAAGSIALGAFGSWAGGQIAGALGEATGEAASQSAIEAGQAIGTSVGMGIGEVGGSLVAASQGLGVSSTGGSAASLQASAQLGSFDYFMSDSKRMRLKAANASLATGTSSSSSAIPKLN